MWPFRPKRRPGRPPSAVYRAIAARHHKVRCCVRGCRVSNPRLLDVHHKDGNPWNNRPRNLEYRCRLHHLEAHGRVMRTQPVVQRAYVTVSPAPRPLRWRWVWLIGMLVLGLALVL